MHPRVRHNSIAALLGGPWHYRPSLKVPELLVLHIRKNKVRPTGRHVFLLKYEGDLDLDRERVRYLLPVLYPAVISLLAKFCTLSDYRNMYLACSRPSLGRSASDAQRITWTYRTDSTAPRLFPKQQRQPTYSTAQAGRMHFLCPLLLRSRFHCPELRRRRDG